MRRNECFPELKKSNWVSLREPPQFNLPLRFLDQENIQMVKSKE